mmetsp:Transcript_145113/g.404305  ORF Transcript_145113/g.404305 Transcript_145113/m.404305 type:complete len:785 (-) Transcript_145113:188-2542(-)
MIRLLSASAALLLSPRAAGAGEGAGNNGPGFNMNGEYLLSQTPGGHDTQAKFPVHFRDYPRGVSSFDVYSPPIRTLYSQVFWKGLDPVPLPKSIVARFDGRGMAVVGFEVDQVRRTPQGDVSVPMTVAYNHHFESTMVGKHGFFEKVHFKHPDDTRLKKLDMGHGIPSHGEMWMVRDRGTSNGTIPISQDFGGANGGEVRKSFHGYAPGFVQVVDSPTHIQVTPMQIDTWHREHMNLTMPTRFVPGPLPRGSEAPPGAQYSGLLECPVTTRIRKEIEGRYAARVSGSCATPIETASECFAAARSTFGAGGRVNFTYSSLSDTALPPGCSATADAQGARSVHVYFNTAAPCTAVACGAGSAHFAGHVASLVQIAVEIDAAKDIVTIALTGPSDVWFGVGFNATAMKDAPWALIVDGAGRVSERSLADQNPGTELPASVTVVSSTSAAGRRSVVLARRLKGASPRHFTFRPRDDTLLSLINAVGSKPSLSYHKAKGPTALALLPIQAKGTAGACLCASGSAPFGKAKGNLVYTRTAQSADTGSGSISFRNVCEPQPRSDLLAMRNPTCDIRSYAGGQSACHHMFSLLDADQDIPWPDQPLEYHLKFRFWVQDYNTSYHTNVKRTTWGIASPVEFDVPKCAAGVKGCEQQQDGSWVHTIAGTFTGGGRLVAAHFHCHAPTCLSVALYRCLGGTKVCNASAGQLLCREDPVYGGTGRVEDPRFDEPGYLLQPPCLWGSAEYGLEAPPDTSGYVLGAVKTSNATHGHHGEMAWLQIYYFEGKERAGVYV